MNTVLTGMWFPDEAPVYTWYSKYLQMLGTCFILRFSYPELLSFYLSIYLKPSIVGEELISCFFKHAAYKPIITVESGSVGKNPFGWAKKYVVPDLQ